MTKLEFIEWAKSRGWWEDRFGHLRKGHNDREYRFKLGSTSVRYEIKSASISSNSGWRRLGSAYFKDLCIIDDGRLAGLK